MRIITYSTAVAIWLLSSICLVAQETQNLQEQISYLKDKVEVIQNEEKDELKKEVILINKRLEKGEVTEEEADVLKKEAAERRALNIENRVAIVQNQIDLLERNGNLNTEDATMDVKFFAEGKVVEVDFNRRKRKYDRRTTSELIWAFGLNNVITEGESLSESDFKVAGSRFFELGWAWRTRVFKNTNWLRIKYGISYHSNGLKLTDNRIFVDTGRETEVQDFEFNLNKSKLRFDHLVFPVHFEVGPSRKIEKEDYFRYSTRKKFKFGFGGYAGFRLRTVQKLKYDAPQGNQVKARESSNFNSNDFIYGVSGYIGWTGITLYAKYDLNPIFKNNPVEQRNISLGLRFDVN